MTQVLFIVLFNGTFQYLESVMTEMILIFAKSIQNIFKFFRILVILGQAVLKTEKDI